jgi:glycogen operon protein
VQAGSPRPLGAAAAKRGVNFALYSSRATRVEVCLFDPKTGVEAMRFDLPARTGDVWHGMVSSRRVKPGSLYSFRVHGPYDPANGERFDAEIELIDPHARALSHEGPLRARIASLEFDWGGDRPPAVPWRDSVIYELHVKGYTALHPAVPPAWRGKYLGLTVAPVIDHIKTLGVTAVELLPCQAFISEQFLVDKGLSNYWGYNSVAWFAPANEYAVEDAVVEFKTMVRALHAAGLEVILDVVFNHTAEGNEWGPTLNLRGIDNPTYYRLIRQDKRYYENVTGCGNTVNCEHPVVRALIVECMKYWVQEMHVDGFRFDLGTVLAREDGGFNENSPFFKAVRADPALAYVKLITEPWDVGLGGYQLGRFPAGWSEWNDRYRDTVRSFWRGDGGRVGELAERLAGSSDLFRHNSRKPSAGINFVTAHDGFTLHDLVAYNDRHNEANRENNADGTGHNLSWNCGSEGPTEDPQILGLRRRQMRNFLATLVLSQGVPMLQAGDEFARTQGGNNNAYCQDNEISWVDWRLATANGALAEFTQFLLRLRRQHPEFRRETFFKGTAMRSGVKDIAWLNARGAEMTHTDWLDGEARCLGAWFGRVNSAAGRMLLLLNAGHLAVEFMLPGGGPSASWVCRFDTMDEIPVHKSLGAVDRYPLGARSVVLLEC